MKGLVFFSLFEAASLHTCCYTSLGVTGEEIDTIPNHPESCGVDCFRHVDCFSFWQQIGFVFRALEQFGGLTGATAFSAH